MANVLSPIVARYNLFFTLAMFSSSPISQSRQPTHLVQSLLVDAHLRYQDKTARKLRALIRNASTKTSSSTSSSATATLSCSVLSSRDHTSLTSSESSDAVSGMPSPCSAVGVAVAKQKEAEEAEVAEKGSLAQRSDERSERERAQLVFTSTVVSTLGDNINNNNSDTFCSAAGAAATVVEIVLDHNPAHDEHQSCDLASLSPMFVSSDRACAQGQTAFAPCEDDGEDRVDTVIPVSTEKAPIATASSHSAPLSPPSAKVSRSSFATLLSVTLTMILLSLLQSKKRSLRKRGLVLRGTSVRRRHSRASKGNGDHRLQRHRRHDSYGNSTSAKDRLSVHSPSAQSSRSNTLSNMEGPPPALRHHLHHQQHQPPRQNDCPQSLSQPQSLSLLHIPSSPSLAPAAAAAHSSSTAATTPITEHFFMDEPGFEVNNQAQQPRHDRLSRPPRALTTLNLEQKDSLPFLGEESHRPWNGETNGMYRAGNLSWSLSDGHLPAASRRKTAKKDLIAAWLDHQDYPAGPMQENEAGWEMDHLQSFQDEHRLTQAHLHHLPQAQPSPQRNEYPGQAEHHSHHVQHQRSEVHINRVAHRDPQRQEPWRGPDGYHTNQTRHASPLHHPQHSHHHYSHPQPLPLYKGSPVPSFYSTNIPGHSQSNRRLPPSPAAQPLSPTSGSRPGGYYHHAHHHPQHHYHHDSSLPRVRLQGYVDPEIDSKPHHTPSMALHHRTSLPPSATPASPSSSTYYAPTRLEDLSPAERVRQEHQMRRQWHQMQQQSIQQFRQQQQQQYQMYRDEQPPINSRGYRQGGSSTGGSLSRRSVPTAALSTNDLGHFSSSASSTAGKSARDLAWERHCYYQQQQLQEEAMAAAAWKRQQKAQQQQPPQQQQQQLAVPESETVVRTSSLNRLTSAGLTSQTAQQLGLSRSKSVQGPSTSSPPLERTHGQDRPSEESPKTRKERQEKRLSKDLPPVTRAKSMTSDCKFLSLFVRKAESSNNRDMADTTKTTITGTKVATTQESVMHLTEAQESTTSLSRKKTIKNLAGSLARRCSSRFSNRSRPNSFAGSGSDRIDLHHTGAAGAKASSHMATTSYPPRELILGPDGVVDLKQAEGEPSSLGASGKQLAASISTPSLPLATSQEQQQQQQQQQQRTPGITRKVTLFRSKTLTLSQSRHASSLSQSSLENSSSTPTPETKGRRHESLRLANGRGVDFALFSKDFASLKKKSHEDGISSSAGQDIVRSTSSLDGALPLSGLYIPNNINTNLNNTNDFSHYTTNNGNNANSNDISHHNYNYTNGTVTPDDIQEETRRQIVALLALGRKDGRSTSTPSSKAVALPTPPKPAVTPVSKIPTMTHSIVPTAATKTTRGLNRAITTTMFISPLTLEALEPPPIPLKKEEPAAEMEEDPCEKISFMLVPKSRYEFQPLVVAAVDPF